MTEDRLEFECPHCRAELAMEDEDVWVMKTPNERFAPSDGSFVGISGTRSIDASPGWRQRSYEFNSGQKADKTSMKAMGSARDKETEPDPAVEDPAITAALRRDYSERSIKSNTNYESEDE